MRGTERDPQFKATTKLEKATSQWQMKLPLPINSGGVTLRICSIGYSSCSCDRWRKSWPL